MSRQVVFKDKGLKNITKALENAPMAKVGVLGSTNSRPDGLSNAEIGQFHEFGLGVPKRSFLRAPLTANLFADLKSQKIDESELEDAVKSGSLEELVRKIGLVGAQTSINSFNTEGDGKWPAHAPGYQNNTGMLLNNLGELKKSINSEVKK